MPETLANAKRPAVVVGKVARAAFANPVFAVGDSRSLVARVACATAH